MENPLIFDFDILTDFDSLQVPSSICAVLNFFEECNHLVLGDFGPKQLKYKFPADRRDISMK